MICGKTIRDGISNETIREITGVEKNRGVLERAEVAMVWAHKKNG